MFEPDTTADTVETVKDVEAYAPPSALCTPAHMGRGGGDGMKKVKCKFCPAMVNTEVPRTAHVAFHHPDKQKVVKA